MTEQAPRTARPIGWLVGGAAALLAFLLCVAAVVVVLVRSDDRGAPREPAGETSAPPTEVEEFGPAPDLCETADFSAVYEILPLDTIGYDRENSGRLYQRSCDLELDDGSSLGLFSLHAVVYPSPERAETAYQEALGVPLVGGQAQEPTGDWDEASLFEGERGTPGRFNEGADAELVVRDGTLVLHLIFGVTGAAADLDGQRAAVFEITDVVRDFMRLSS